MYKKINTMIFSLLVACSSKVTLSGTQESAVQQEENPSVAVTLLSSLITRFAITEDGSMLATLEDEVPFEDKVGFVVRVWQQSPSGTYRQEIDKMITISASENQTILLQWLKDNSALAVISERNEDSVVSALLKPDTLEDAGHIASPLEKNPQNFHRTIYFNTGDSASVSEKWIIFMRAQKADNNSFR